MAELPLPQPPSTGTPEGPSPKQRTYCELLSLTLPYLRNIATLPWWRRLARKHSVRFETELIHYLPAAMFERGFGAADLWFLNHHARTYCEQCSAALSPLYPTQLSVIRALFDLVPEEMRGKLEWAGPAPPALVVLPMAAG